jgi:hypothetical protein
VRNPVWQLFDMVRSFQVGRIRLPLAQDAPPITSPAVVFQPDVPDRTPGYWVLHRAFTYHRVNEHCMHADKTRT